MKNPYDFECKMCGNCCRGSGSVFVNQKKIRQMAKYLNMNFLDFELKYITKWNNQKILKSKWNEDCIFLENNLCEVQKVKPDQCKAWPFWPELFQFEKAFQDAKNYCEGLKDFEFKDFANSPIKPPKTSNFKV